MNYSGITTLAFTLFFCSLAFFGHSQEVDANIDAPAPVPTQDLHPEWWVDANSTGNTAAQLGSIQRCTRATDKILYEVDVAIYNTQDLAGYRFRMYFDDAYVQFNSAKMDMFLTSAGGTLGDAQALFDPAMPNAVTIAANLADGAPKPSGNGVLCRLIFAVREPYGQSGFDLDPAQSFITREIVPGTIIVVDYTINNGYAQAYFDPKGSVGCWTVTEKLDEADLKLGDGVCDTDPTPGKIRCSLRAAIQESNATEGPNRVTFRIFDQSLECGVPCTLQPNSRLPALEDPTGGTALDGSAYEGVEINGAFAGVANGIHIKSDANTVRSLTINGFENGSGIFIESGNENTIRTCYLGADVSGKKAVPNVNGLRIESAENTVYGCLLSGNKELGLLLRGPNAVLNTVEWCTAGLDAAAGAPLPNGVGGIAIRDTATFNCIGDSLGNYISGNAGFGVEIEGRSSLNDLSNNLIGTDLTGKVKIGNKTNGVQILAGSEWNSVGYESDDRNVISGNGQNGVYIAYSDNNWIIGNYIGTDLPGLAEMGNAKNGIELYRSSKNVIGGYDTDDRNIISGNFENGVLITGGERNEITGNLIGLSASLAKLGNLQNGIWIDGSAKNQLGGETDKPGDPPGNQIACNANGIKLTNQANENVLLGNRIFENKQHGILILDSQHNRIGNLKQDGANILAQNWMHGMLIKRAFENRILGNLIGTDLAGAELGNQLCGIALDTMARDNFIGQQGDNTADFLNRIAFNAQAGVLLTPEAGTGNLISRTLFSKNGDLAIDLNADGPTLNDPKDEDEGPNELLNFLTFLTVQDMGDSLKILLMMQNKPDAKYLVELYASDACDPAGYGEGAQYLGKVDIQIPDGMDVYSEIVTIPDVLKQRAFLTGTATDEQNNTSEFSACFDYVSSTHNISANGQVDIFPNPFFHSASIHFKLPVSQDVRLDLLDSGGRVLSTLFQGRAQANTGYTALLSGSTIPGVAHLPGGMYYVRLQGEQHSQVYKLVKL